MICLEHERLRRQFVDVQLQYKQLLDDHDTGRLSEAGVILDGWKKLMDLKTGELRRSRDLWDRIYVGRYLDRLPTQFLAMRCGITRVHVYRILKKIENAVNT